MSIYIYTYSIPMHRISRIVELLVQVHSPPGYVHLLWARSCSCLPATQSLLRADSMLVYRYSSMTLHGGKQSAEVLEKHSSCKSLSGSTILQNVSTTLVLACSASCGVQGHLELPWLDVATGIPCQFNIATKPGLHVVKPEPKTRNSSLLMSTVQSHQRYPRSCQYLLEVVISN